MNPNQNPFPSLVPMPSSGGAMQTVEGVRAAQEIQAAIIVAKKYPRDMMAAYQRIMDTCKRKTFAEKSIFALPRGGQTISGPSIRMAEAIVQLWGNMRAGIRELETDGSSTTAEAYCWDLETNVSMTKTFTVRHERKAKGKVEALTDPKDIADHVGNFGSRRLRACIFATIPKDIIDAAEDQARATLDAQDADVPLIDRIRKMVSSFGEVGVTQSMIEERLGHKIDVTIQKELAELRVIFLTLRNGEGERSKFFRVDPATTGPAADLNATIGVKPEAPPAAEPEPVKAVEPEVVDEAPPRRSRKG